MPIGNVSSTGRAGVRVADGSSAETPSARSSQPPSDPRSPSSLLRNGGQPLTQVRGGTPDRLVNGVRVREGVLHDNPGPILSQNYWRDSNGHIHHDWDRAEGSEPDISFAGCGQTTASVLLQRFGHFANEAAADDHMRRPGNLGGSLYALGDYYRMRGLEASVNHGGSWGDLRTALDQGFGLQITLTHESSPHTMSVTGMFLGEDGKEYIQLMDVNDTGSRLMTREDFERQWNELQLGGQGGIRTGISRTYIVVGPSGAQLPSGGSLWGELNSISSQTLLDGFNDLSNSFRYFGEGEVLGGVARFMDGVIQTSIQAPAIIGQAAGAGVEWVGDKGVDWAMDTFKDPESSFWDKLAAAFVMVFAFPTKWIGAAVRQVSQLAGAVTGLAARALATPFNALADWLHQDNDAANTVRYADPNGTSREKDNWRRLRDTPHEPGKTYLINTMLAGSVSDEERAMILRVLNSCADPQGDVDQAQLQSLISAIGVERLDQLFANTRENSAWGSLREQGLPRLDASPEPSTESPQPTASSNNAVPLAANSAPPSSSPYDGLPAPKGGISTKRS